jgi:PAS domain-containing protein
MSRIDLTTAHSHSVQELIGWLEDRELRLQLAIEAADLGTWNWDQSTDEVAWSDKCRQLLDLAPDSLASMAQVQQQIHPEDRDAVHQAIATSMSSLSNCSIEYRIVLRDVTSLHRAAEASL